MLKGFDQDIAGLEIPDEVKQQLIEAANKRASGLTAKNEELLGKLTSTKQQAGENQSAAEKLAAMEALQEQKQLEAKQNYQQALDMTTKKSQTQIEELAKKVQGYEEKEKEQVINSEISNQLTELRINPLYQKMATSLFKSQTQLIDGKAMVGEKSLSEAIIEWSDTDEGKASRLAPDNTGGNANGGTQKSGSGNNMTPSEKRAADINKRFGKN